MKKYNVWIIVEQMDEDTDEYATIEEAQVKLRTFDTLQKAEKYQRELYEENIYDSEAEW